MGVMNFHLTRIGQALKSRQSQHIDIAFLGYPDLAADSNHIIEAFGEENFSKCSALPDNPNRWNLLELLNVSYKCNIRVFDVSCHRGMEEILNFNDPLPDDLKNAFDFVFDSSCLEHCFNVAQAFQNMCEAVKVGGTVITIAPIYLFNHGYYNINPIMHQDGFTHNGFKLLHQNIINGSGEVVGLHPKKDNPRNTYILSVACKETEQTFSWPIQTHKGLGINYTDI